MSAIVWMDMEMSGLDPDTDRILEVAVLVTDGELEVVAEGPNLVLHQSDEVLAAMDEWNTCLLYTSDAADDRPRV